MSADGRIAGVAFASFKARRMQSVARGIYDDIVYPRRGRRVLSPEAAKARLLARLADEGRLG